LFAVFSIASGAHIAMTCAIYFYVTDDAGCGGNDRCFSLYVRHDWWSSASQRHILL